MEKWQERPPSSSSTIPTGEMTSVGFADAARRINRAAASAGLRTPAFRSPPRQPGLVRSIARRPDGSATVSVSLRGRPTAAVIADMIAGVMAANADGVTVPVDVGDRLWAAAAPCLVAPPDPRPVAPVGRRVARSVVRQPERRAERPAA